MKKQRAGTMTKAELIAEIKKIRVTYPPEHSQVAAIDRQIERLAKYEKK